MNRLAQLSLLVAMACAVPSAWAQQGLLDPTRPPPGWLPPDPKVPGQPKVESDTGAVPVQILLVGKTRRFALVRGDPVGDKTKGMKLVEVKRNQVVVQSDRGRETLNLFPDVQKTPPRKRAGMGNKEQ